MKAFRKYQSVKRPRKWLRGSKEAFLDGPLYVFPKLDGANASIWLNGEGGISYGSRNRDLSLGDESFQGFTQFVSEHKERFTAILLTFNSLAGHSCTIYGEWLVPHTVKTYTEDMWKKFWIFDVMYLNDDGAGVYVDFNTQNMIIENKEGYPYLIPCVQFYPTGMTEQELLDAPLLNKFGIKEDSGHGEGVVIKRYDIPCEHWMKVIHDDFSNQKQIKAEKAPVDMEREKQIVDFFMDSGLINKEYAKLMFEDPEMPKGKVIPRLLQQVYQSFIDDNIWAIVKKYRNPTINFGMLKKLTDQSVRDYKAELF